MPNEITVDLRNPNLDRRSDLLKAQSRAIRGKVNACPFGCTMKDLDTHGYCKHLVGFTQDGEMRSRKEYEPMVLDEQGLRVVRCRRVKIEGEFEVEHGEYDETLPKRKPVYKIVLEKLQPGDVLVRISSSHRVYRDIVKSGAVPMQRTEAKEAGKLTLDEQDKLLREQLDNLAKTAFHEPELVGEPMEQFAVVGEE